MAIVTGGALGIGRATCLRLAEDGYDLVVVDIDIDAVAALQREVEAIGRECTVVIGDVTEDPTVESLAQVLESVGRNRVDVLVNNVGDFRPARAVFHKSDATQWRRLHELNFWHVLTVSHLVLPAMIERGRGSIVNVSTVEAFRGIPANTVYSGYKAAVSAFTKSLAVELGPSGIRVNAIAPDLADTPQTPAELMLGGRSEELIKSWVPLGRFGDPNDSAAVISFLVSDDSRFVTGHTIPVDGGTLAASGWYQRAKTRGWTNLPNEA